MAAWELVVRARKEFVKKGLWALGLLACGCGKNPVLQMQEYSTVDGKETLNGSGCVGTDNGETTGAGTGVAPGGDTPGPGYSYEYDGTGDGVHFVVRDGTGAELATRDYDGVFLDSGKRDEVIVEPGGISVRFVHWGAKVCEGSSAVAPE
jgi:hypothetical protein